MPALPQQSQTLLEVGLGGIWFGRAVARHGLIKATLEAQYVPERLDRLRKPGRQRHGTTADDLGLDQGLGITQLAQHVPQVDQRQRVVRLDL